MVAIEPAQQADEWTIAGGAPNELLLRCANLATPSICNWLIPIGTTENRVVPTNLYAGKCLACSLTRMIPNLDSANNAELYRRLETAKRRLVSQLLALALPVETRLERPNGIVFDMLENLPGQPKVLTGHDEA